jgi:hypothetical protein
VPGFLRSRTVILVLAGVMVMSGLVNAFLGHKVSGLIVAASGAILLLRRRKAFAGGRWPLLALLGFAVAGLAVGAAVRSAEGAAPSGITLQTTAPDQAAAAAALPQPTELPKGFSVKVIKSDYGLSWICATKLTSNVVLTGDAAPLHRC